jgi:thiamine-phosphate pyrophosphorylase
MKALADCRLYTFVDTAYLHGKSVAEIAQRLCDGGSDLIQLRAKDSSIAEIRQMAGAILPITRQAGVGLVINDHLPVALELGTEFCHLGQEDFFGDEKNPPLNIHLEDGGVESRNPQNHRVQIGLSSHAPEQAARALTAQPAYIAIGPVYATGTKPGAKPVTLDYVRWAADTVTIPWFAIGGINLNNLPDVLAAGARRICVVSAVLNTPDIAQACRNFKQYLL